MFIVKHMMQFVAAVLIVDYDRDFIQRVTRYVQNMVDKF